MRLEVVQSSEHFRAEFHVPTVSGVDSKNLGAYALCSSNLAQHTM